MKNKLTFIPNDYLLLLLFLLCLVSRKSCYHRYLRLSIFTSKLSSSFLLLHHSNIHLIMLIIGVVRLIVPGLQAYKKKKSIIPIVTILQEVESIFTIVPIITEMDLSSSLWINQSMLLIYGTTPSSSFPGTIINNKEDLQYFVVFF